MPDRGEAEGPKCAEAPCNITVRSTKTGHVTSLTITLVRMYYQYYEIREVDYDHTFAYKYLCTRVEGDCTTLALTSTLLTNYTSSSTVFLRLGTSPRLFQPSYLFRKDLHLL